MAERWLYLSEGAGRPVPLGEIGKIAANRTTESPVNSYQRWPFYADLGLETPPDGRTWPSTLGAQDFPDLAIDSRRVLGCFVDQVKPLPIIIVERPLRQKVRGLHNGFNRITEIVCQGAQFGNCLALQLLALFHCRLGYTLLSHVGIRTYTVDSSQQVRDWTQTRQFSLFVTRDLMPNHSIPLATKLSNPA